MLDNELKSYLLPNLFNAAVRAGAAIMQVYKNKEDYDISIKSDKTPITVADHLFDALLFRSPCPRRMTS